MSVALIQQALHSQTRTLSVIAWLNEEDARSQQINVIRRYVSGAPDNFLTAGQAKLLNIPQGSQLHQFSDNYCPAILDTTLDRIQLTGIQADTDVQQQWIDDLLTANRMDELQVNVHDATLRDGNGFLMVDAVEDKKGVRAIRFTQEPAYDGFYGMAVMYETANSKQPLIAVKVWRITSDKLADTVRLNVYYPNRIERYTSFIGGGIRPYGADVDIGALEAQYQAAQASDRHANNAPLATDPALPPGYPPGPDDTDPSIIPWTMDNASAEVIHNPDGTVTVTGEPIGVPIVHFRHKGNNINTHGQSDLVDVIPLQDLMNRTLYDMAATSALSAFGVRVAIGFQAPTAIEPGMVVSIVAKDSDGVPVLPNEVSNEWLKTVRIDQFEQADMVPYINQLQWIKNEMFAVTNTPENENASANASGESLRQREVKLIGKVKRFEVRNGNSWEDAMLLAARVQTAFSSEKPPALDTLNAKWADAEIRNDTVTQANAVLLYQNGLIDHETALNMIKDIYDWDEKQVQAIIAATMRAMGQNQIGAEDAQGVMTRLQQAQQTAKSGGTTAAGAKAGSDPQPAQPQKPPAPTQSGAAKVTVNGQQDTSGA